MKTRYGICVLILLTVLTGCALNAEPSGQTPVVDTNPSPQASTVIVTPTEVPTIVESTPAQVTPSAYGGQIPLPAVYQFREGVYMDDRSSNYQTLVSYFNALHRGLLPMAYYFWNDQAANAGSYDQFAAEHEGIQPHEMTIHRYGSSGAAGSIFATAAVSLKGVKGDQPAEWVGCYTLRTPNPANFDGQTYQARHIAKGKLVELAAGEDLNAALGAPCEGFEFGIEEANIPGPDGSGAYDAEHYLDTRSDASMLVLSFWNSLNRKEYARAYSFFEAPTIFPGPYTTFRDGYKGTATVSGHLGTVSQDAAAGNRYWKVPTNLRAITDDGVQQSFIGCYILHQSVPELYAAPPFQPMAIQKANFVASNPNISSEDLKTALDHACDNLP